MQKVSIFLTKLSMNNYALQVAPGRAMRFVEMKLNETITKAKQSRCSSVHEATL